MLKQGVKSSVTGAGSSGVAGAVEPPRWRSCRRSVDGCPQGFLVGLCQRSEGAMCRQTEPTQSTKQQAPVRHTVFQSPESREAWRLLVVAGAEKTAAFLDCQRDPVWICPHRAKKFNWRRLLHTKGLPATSAGRGVRPGIL